MGCSPAAYLPLFSALALGCADDSLAGGAGGGDGGGGEAGAPSLDFEAGGDRPVTVRVPPTYDPNTPAPLVVLLHGYGATGFLQDVYLELSQPALDRGVIFVAPTGTEDSLGRAFWNATSGCCNFDDLEVDDDAYLMGLVDEISATLNVDPARVFFVGHSNGGFMSHRLACDHADRVAAITVLAGAMELDTSSCQPSEPVSVMQIHGTADDTIAYEGGVIEFEGQPHDTGYPSVDETVGRWVMVNQCSPNPAAGEPLDLDVSLDGAETEVSLWSGCEAGTEVELWALQGGSHIPPFDYTLGGRIMDWLLAHPN